MDNCEFQQTTIIVIHEIYGINNHINAICDYLKTEGHTVFCPNLLGITENYCYKDENKAYNHFVHEIGFNSAVDKVITLAKELRPSCTNLYILGFSVGATVAWLCSKYEGLFDGVIGFYGSRIRDYLEVTPKCETLLIFPTNEKSFDPKNVIKKLQTKNSTRIIEVEGKHGFTDQSTSNYEKHTTELCFHSMREFITKQNHRNNLYSKTGGIK